MSIFKDCDIRGVVPEEITEATAYAIGQAFASLFPEGTTFAVGGDVRIHTPPLKEALIAGLTQAGGNVFDLGIVPTPLFYFAIDHLKTQAGIMVTASHNPPQYNGFKIGFADRPPTPEDFAVLAERIREGNFRESPKGRVSWVHLEDAYFEFLATHAPRPKKTLRVVVDCGNGCYSYLAPRFLRHLGYEVHELFCSFDGTFPNRPPNPAQAKNLSALSAKVCDVKAHAGVAFDGDGDRVVFVADTGRVLSGEEGMIFFIRYHLAAQPGERKFVYDLKCSSIVPEEIRRIRGIPLPERSGHAYIKRRLLKENATMAGEISGHYFFQELGRDDGLYAASLFLALLSQRSEPLSQIVATFPRSYVTPDIRIPRQNRENLLTLLEERIATGTISHLDGLRVEWEDGWALIRKSVTEPVYTLRFEGKNPESIPELVRRLLGPFPEIEKEVLEKLSSDFPEENALKTLERKSYQRPDHNSAPCLDEVSRELS
ncbi:MAG: phosphomannomutase/phosphoglucomutase [Candidatus Caldatribacterium sp.]|nr:phosphomannomutase/phosphoglucomutase [Candidatus Caldatribacterium sp.]